MQHHLGWYPCTYTQIYCSKWHHIPEDRNILCYQCESLNLTCISSCLPTILYGLQNWKKIYWTKRKENKRQTDKWQGKVILRKTKQWALKSHTSEMRFCTVCWESLSFTYTNILEEPASRRKQQIPTSTQFCACNCN